MDYDGRTPEIRSPSGAAGSPAPGATTIHVFRSRLLVLLALTALIVACSGGEPQPGKIGQPAPAISGPALDGSQVDLASLRGRPVVVNFWASWCVPCREEFPLFEQKLAELGPTDGLAIVGVLYKDEPELAQRFLDEVGEAWPTLDDADGALAADYRVVAPPQTYFIDADGVLQAIHIGQVESDEFDAAYAKIKP